MKITFWRENVKILPYFAQRYNGRHYIKLLICKPLMVYRFYCMALYITPRGDVVIKLKKLNVLIFELKLPAKKA